MTSAAGLILVNDGVAGSRSDRRLLRVADARLAFAQAAYHLQPAAVGMIDSTAVISASAILGKNVMVGAGAVIGEGVCVGDGCSIGPRVVLEAGVVLHNRVLIQAGAVLGGLWLRTAAGWFVPALSSAGYRRRGG